MDFQVSGTEFMVRIYDNDRVEQAVNDLNREFVNKGNNPVIIRQYREKLAVILYNALVEFEDDPLNYIEATSAPDKTVREINV